MLMRAIYIREACYTNPISVVSTVPLLCGPLGQHLEMDQLHLAHMLVRIIVEVKVYHQISPAGRGRFVEAIFDATQRHLCGIQDVLCHFRESFHFGVDDSAPDEIADVAEIQVFFDVVIVLEHGFLQHPICIDPSCPAACRDI